MATKYAVRVFHSLYGCDTGCCGHRVEIKDDGGNVNSAFEFTHPWSEDVAGWARSVAEDVIGREWPDCLASIDWSTLDVSEVSDD